MQETFYIHFVDKKNHIVLEVNLDNFLRFTSNEPPFERQPIYRKLILGWSRIMKVQERSYYVLWMLDCPFRPFVLSTADFA